MESRPRPNAIVELLAPLAEVWKGFWAKRAVLNELARCDSATVAFIAQDLGISAADLGLLARRDKTAADLLYRRLKALRLDPTSVDPAVMRDLQRCCSNCDSKRLCAHELEDKPRSATWPKYCPNEDTIAALTAESSREGTSR
jgi:uncharacterized protein DUF6455